MHLVGKFGCERRCLGICEGGSLYLIASFYFVDSGIVEVCLKDFGDYLQDAGQHEEAEHCLAESER